MAFYKATTFLKVKILPLTNFLWNKRNKFLKIQNSLY